MSRASSRARASPVERAVAEAHRREWAFVLAATVRVARDLDLAEECVQEAYVAALDAWKRDGVPARPGAWLTTAAKRKALDALRRGQTFRSKIPLLVEPEETQMDELTHGAVGSEEAGPDDPTGGAVPDDRLRLIFTCCHPALTREAQVALTLRFICGVSTGDIARAFLVSKTTMAARLTRAKKKISAAHIPYRVPQARELPERLDAVHTVIHLLYTTGHTAPSGERLVRVDLVGRALDLARMLQELMPAEREVRGLLALLLVTDARRSTRTDDHGRLLLLQEQDRSAWDKAAIEEGHLLVLDSLRGGNAGRYALQAAIAALHAQAPSYAETDWPQILVLYDELLKVWPSPVVALNRAVAVAEVRGPEVALREVETLERDGRLSGYRYLQSTKADLLRRLGRHHEAPHSYRAALDLADNEAERRFLASRLAESSGRRGSASLRREFVTRGVASNPWERVGKPVDYLCTGRVGIAETNRQRVRILAVGARDGRLRVTETDLELGDGRTLHAYDTGADDEDGRLAVFWHHGSPNIGAPPEPLFPAAEELGVRWVSYDRPGYGGSTPLPDRDVASAAADVSRVADALGIDRFAVMGHSGGGSHALACAALLPERVLGAVVVAGMAPYHAEGLDWFEGFSPGGEAQLRAAAAGRAALEKYLAESDDEPGFTPEDEAALAGEWSWFIDIVRPALAGGMGGFIDDDLAGVGAWGFEPADIVAPTLFLHGGRDRVVPSSHGEWLARRCPSSELWLRPDDGHISVLNYGAAALGWLREHAHRG